jgi:hypothetical protein
VKKEQHGVVSVFAADRDPLLVAADSTYRGRTRAESAGLVGTIKSVERALVGLSLVASWQAFMQ